MSKLPTAVLSIRGSDFRIPHSCISKTLNSEKLTKFLSSNNDNQQEIRYELNRPMEPFKAILEYCHNGKLHLPPSVCPGLFRDELEFWGIVPDLLQKCCRHRYQNFIREERNLCGFENMFRDDEKGSYNSGPKNLKLKSKIWNLLEFSDSSVGSKIYFYIATIMIIMAVLNIVLITSFPDQHHSSVNSSQSASSNDKDSNQQQTSNIEDIKEPLPTTQNQSFYLGVQCRYCKKVANSKSLRPFIKNKNVVIGRSKAMIELLLLDCCTIKNNNTLIFPMSSSKERANVEVTRGPTTLLPPKVKIERFVMGIYCHSCSKLFWPFIQQYDVVADRNQTVFSLYMNLLDCCSFKTNWKPAPHRRKRSSVRNGEAKDNTTEDQDITVTTSASEALDESSMSSQGEETVTPHMYTTMDLLVSSQSTNTSIIHAKNHATLIIGAATSLGDVVKNKIKTISELAGNRLGLTTFIEYITTLFFMVEFVLRFLSCPNKRRYLHGYLNCIDFVLLVASLGRIFTMFLYETVDNLFLTITMYISMFRVLRLFRIVENMTAFKVLRYALRISKGDLSVLIMYLLVAMFIFSNFIYLFENEADFPSIPDAWWWSIVTMTTVGYGDMYPKTLAGKIVGSFCAIFGVVMLSLVIPVFVNTFLTIYEYADYYKRTDNELDTSTKGRNSRYENKDLIAMDAYVSKDT